MNHRERMLAAFAGEASDRIPWAPRMELWYIAERARGTLPAHLAKCNSANDVAIELGLESHAVRGDLSLDRPAEDLALRGLGVENHPDFPFRVELHDLPVDFSMTDGLFRTVIETRHGDVIMEGELTDEMLRAGASRPSWTRHAVMSLNDLPKVAEVFAHLEVIPTADAYSAFKRRIGDQGIAIANGSIGASPMHQLLNELVPMETFYILWAEDRDALQRTAKAMEPFFDLVLDALLQCDAEAVFWGANYDHNVTWPPFFEAEIVPWLRRVRERLHAGGKRLLSHTDGENLGLLPFYPEAGFDIAESVCPIPMTKSSLREIRDAMGPSITVWGGLPAVAFLPESMADDAFEAYLDTLFAELGSARSLILGVSDNVPPGADLTRLAAVGERVEAFGPVGTE